MRLGIAALALTLVLAPFTTLDVTAEQDPLAVPCGNGPAGIVMEQTTNPDGTVSHCLAYPAQGDIDTLVVFAHGRGQTVQGAWLGHMVETAQHGAAAVAMNYPDNFGFPTQRGAVALQDAACDALERLSSELKHDIGRFILLGVSMGGSISGTALHTHSPCFINYSTWIDVEGVANTAETYAEAKAIGDPAADGIERDIGFTPDEDPVGFAQALQERSPAFNAGHMAAHGLEDVVIVHSVFDGLVPYWQGRTMQAALAEEGILTEFHTVVRGEGEGHGTTPLDHAGLGAANTETVGLAGHAWEGDRDHPIMAAALGALFDLLDGERFSPGEFVHDAEDGTVGTGL